MSIKISKPYFIKIAYNDVDFSRIQHELFDDGYEWLNGKVVWSPSKIFEFNYPVFISNLTFIDKKTANKFTHLRNQFNKHYNNILFFGQNENDFDIKLLRFEKLKKIQYENNI